MRHVRAHLRTAGRSAIIGTALSLFLAVFAAAGSAAISTAVGDPVATTTTLDLRADGTGTVRVVVGTWTVPGAVHMMLAWLAAWAALFR